MFVLPNRYLTGPVLTSALLAALTPACSPTATTAPSPFDDTVAALCQALVADEIGVADVAFNAGAHAELHELAKQVIEVDRATAGDLLASKNVVETTLRRATSIAELTSPLEALLAEVRRSLTALDLPAPSC